VGKDTRGNDKWVLLIGAAKLLKGVALLVVAIGILKLFGKDIDDTLTRWIQQLNVDPHNDFCRKLIGKAAQVNWNKAPWYASATLLYSGLFLTEGAGLLFRQHWAEWLTVIITASFLPLEIYEVMRHFTAARLIIILLNAVIVVYLIWRIYRRKKT
jgi:uncharacterized membrane protein (DUF2068 family)